MRVKTDKDEIVGYLEDSSNFRGGLCEAVYLPENEADVVEAIEECRKKKRFLTASGGGTGTVGGRIATEGAMVSTEKLDKILKLTDEYVEMNAGVVIQDLLASIAPLNRFYPPFPTERTAFIGGNIATNASGEYSFRFGATRRYIEKVRMVTGTGEVVELVRGRAKEDSSGTIQVGNFQIQRPNYTTPSIKCAAGYFSQEGMDAIDLVIGSEGTFGVITSVGVRLIPSLPERFILIIFLPGESRALEFLSEVRRDMTSQMYTLEFFDEGALEFLKEDYPEIPNHTCGFFIESVFSEEMLTQWFEISERYQAVNVVASHDSITYERLLKFRHRLPENINAYFKRLQLTKISLDIAVPQDKFEELFRFYRSITSSTSIQTVLFGHIGENHLHFNFFPKDDGEREKVQTFCIDSILKALSLGGTVSAEHGIGKIKHRYLHMMFGDEGIREMIRVKKIFDPDGILGPNNLFPIEQVDSIVQ
ncbi:MAG: FAD-binding oxidoreductase [Candidatus Ratteibacteria bacterium]|jgi:D-lactate dehydrogenase (cytochrome)